MVADSAVCHRCDTCRRSPGAAVAREPPGAVRTAAVARSPAAPHLVGHQNQRPIIAATDGIMNERTINVSNNRPSAMVVHLPITLSGLIANVAIVAANTRPADVTTAPVPAIDRMIRS